MGGLTSRRPHYPPGFEDVILARELKMGYWELMAQPAFFLDQYKALMAGEEIAKQILNTRGGNGRQKHKDYTNP